MATASVSRMGVLSMVRSAVEWLARQLDPDELGAPTRAALAEQARQRAAAEAARRAKATPMLDGRVLESLPDPVILVDRDSVVVMANRAASAMLGFDPRRRTLALAVRHPAILGAVEAVMAGEAEQFLEVTLPGAVERSYRIHAAGLPDAPAPLAGGAVLILHDITAAKRAEDMRADFVANVSHELRTPLSSLSGFIETLQGAARDDAEARERFLAIMEEEARRMARLVDDLLSLSRVEINEHVAPSDRVDLRALLDGVARTLSVRAAEKAMSITVECSDGEDSVVFGDRDQLIQVFQNLTDNAVKYAREGTTVRLTLTRHDSADGFSGAAVAIAVSDRGPGIPARHLPRLTERFYRADKARSRRLGGTGLGLAIVKHIVSRHRGRLSIESTEGIGSTFTVLLPAADAPVKPAQSAAFGE